MMATNPDNKDYLGKDAYLSPTEGMLRFVERSIPSDKTKLMRMARILERYEWSAELKKWGWFDVQLWTGGDGEEGD